MMESYELDKAYQDKITKFALLTNKLNPQSLNTELNHLKETELSPKFWDDNKQATKVIKQKQELENKLDKFNLVSDLLDQFSLAQDLFNQEELSLVELNEEYERLNKEFISFEMQTLLNQEYDHDNAYLEIHPGSGGTESQDWANMIYRMYELYCKKHNLKMNVVDCQPADVGLKSVLVEIKGDDAYGLLKGENGIHRLVRISPFDANKKRHTSFCSVKVMPIIETDDEIEINESELKIDRYRSSGAGGQSVNTTDSAIRITHIPTGIVVTCQNERSQVQNKQQALKILQAKLLEMQLQEQQLAKEKLNGNTKEIGWGSQKRSYVLHPYKMVKDNISGYETQQAEKILDGNIEELLYYNLVCNEE